ncbi:Geranylgeranyl transferase type-1 subunit beta [Thoreauomyces humboldtii]|nr:Geranylgeranyl transferase type-1 subunit beta [Thoreauomyces humboldtii]
MTVAYFCLGALDVMGCTDEIGDKDRAAWKDWIYAQQIHSEGGTDGSTSLHCGFRGAPFAGAPHRPDSSTSSNAFDTAHITMTYTALASLLILRDDLARVDKKSIVASLKQLQQPNGSFAPYHGSTESDMRFLYCACVISHILDDWSGVDRDLATRYVLDSITYEHAFAQAPGQEAHGGSTYCAVAALVLMGRMDRIPDRRALVGWLVGRQGSGFCGRAGKPEDTCYSFWIGASIEILGAYHFVDTDRLRGFLSLTHTKHGGFGKEAGDHPDLLHSYMGLAGLALTNTVPTLLPLDAATGLTKETLAHLFTLRGGETKEVVADEKSDVDGLATQMAGLRTN